MNPEGFPAGTTERERRELQEFERTRREFDEQWSDEQLTELAERQRTRKENEMLCPQCNNKPGVVEECDYCSGDGEVCPDCREPYDVCQCDDWDDDDDDYDDEWDV